MSNAKWTGFFKIVQPTDVVRHAKMTDSQNMGGSGAYNNYSWYHTVLQGSASRLAQYREYDMMDNDVEVARALDTIAEEVSGNDPKTDEPIKIHLRDHTNNDQRNSQLVTLRTALDKWNSIHDWENRVFKIARNTIKYGDTFFRKHRLKDTKAERWEFIHSKNVRAAIVDENDITNITHWEIQEDVKRTQNGQNVGSLGTVDNNMATRIIPANEMVRFTLNDDMSDAAPFGDSILRSVYRAHKQKELLEDAIIIYRIQRAPERRVFYIDVGKMNPVRAKAHIEMIKNDIKQKQVPTMNGGQMDVDSVYNPQSMSEDFYFAAGAEGKGSRVETMPGGQGLGSLEDLEYFQKKVWRGLRVPASYMMEAAEGGAMYVDGKVGQAYVQEIKFALFIARIQSNLEVTLDKEFKKFLRLADINIDESTYVLRLPESSNFGKYRQQELDAAMLGTYSSADSVQYMSKRFAMERFLQMTPEEISRNEALVREEKGIDINDNSPQTLQAIYAGGMDGGMGGMPMGGGMDVGMGGGLGGEDPGMSMDGEGMEADPMAANTDSGEQPAPQPETPGGEEEAPI